MLYFNGREDDAPVEDAHRALQFKLSNINPKDSTLENVIAHEAGMNANHVPLYDNLQKWANEFIKQAKAILAHKANVEEHAELTK